MIESKYRSSCPPPEGRPSRLQQLLLTFLHHAIGRLFTLVAALSARMSSIYDFAALQSTGKPLPMKQFKGKVLLIVNTASACGFTPQLAGLQDLHQGYTDKGLVILGFPCNQFGAQDPADNSTIATFCQRNYGVQFPIMAKVEVNGSRAEPLWQWLAGQAPGLLGSKAIKWNFTKFLVGRDGKVLKRYAPTDTPQSLADDIEAALLAN